MSNVAAVAMKALWFQQVMGAARWDQFNVSMDQSTLAAAVANPADALRLLVWVSEDDGLEGDRAAELCEVPRDAFFSHAAPTLSAADWERALARLALSMLASWRNEWRRQQGRPVEEMEDVTQAPADFFAMVAAGIRLSGFEH